MVSIHSDEEQDFVVGLNGQDHWLGGKRDPANRDNFVWTDGTPWDYTNWEQGQPDDYGGDEDCTQIWDRSNEEQNWNDRICWDVRGFVCKKGNNSLTDFD